MRVVEEQVQVLVALVGALSVDYGGKSKLSFPSVACPHVATAVVELYNTVLRAPSVFEHTDVTIIMDNEALYDICRCRLHIARPVYINLNRRLVQSFPQGPYLRVLMEQ